MPRKPKYYTAEVSLPVSLHQQVHELKKALTIEELREELGKLLGKTVATLDWLLENGTPGTKLGAAQTLLQVFVPKAPQVVEQLNYDVADLSPDQQKQVIDLARSYRAIVGSTGQGRGSSGEAGDRRTQAQALLLPGPEPDNPEDWAGWPDPEESPRESIEGQDSGGREQVGEEYVGNDRDDSLGAGAAPVAEDP